LVADGQIEDRAAPRVEALTLGELGASVVELALRHELLSFREHLLGEVAGGDVVGAGDRGRRGGQERAEARAEDDTADRSGDRHGCAIPLSAGHRGVRTWDSS